VPRFHARGQAHAMVDEAQGEPRMEMLEFELTVFKDCTRPPVLVLTRTGEDVPCVVHVCSGDAMSLVTSLAVGLGVDMDMKLVPESVPIG
jgi:hypothetical protein